MIVNEYYVAFIGLDGDRYNANSEDGPVYDNRVSSRQHHIHPWTLHISCAELPFVICSFFAPVIWLEFRKDVLAWGTKIIPIQSDQLYTALVG